MTTAPYLMAEFHLKEKDCTSDHEDQFFSLWEWLISKTLHKKEKSILYILWPSILGSFLIPAYLNAIYIGKADTDCQVKAMHVSTVKIESPPQHPHSHISAT